MGMKSAPLFEDRSLADAEKVARISIGDMRGHKSALYDAEKALFRMGSSPLAAKFINNHDT